MIARRAVKIPTEHGEQVAVVSWWGYECKKHGLPEFALFAVPNGGGRSKVGAALLKAEGVRSGVADLILAVPRWRYHGLFLEMKRRQGGRTSEEQMAFLAYAHGAGYMTYVAEGADEAMRMIAQYLVQTPPAGGLIPNINTP